METDARVLCWRDKEAEQGQMQMTLASLRKALSRVRYEVEDMRAQALRSLAGSWFCEVERRIRVLSKRMRRKEKGRSRLKIENLERREKSCHKHQVCRWVRNYQRQQEQVKKRVKRKIKNETYSNPCRPGMNKRIIKHSHPRACQS